MIESSIASAPVIVTNWAWSLITLIQSTAHLMVIYSRIRTISVWAWSTLETCSILLSPFKTGHATPRRWSALIRMSIETLLGWSHVWRSWTTRRVAFVASVIWPIWVCAFLRVRIWPATWIGVGRRIVIWTPVGSSSSTPTTSWLEVVKLSLGLF